MRVAAAAILLVVPLRHEGGGVAHLMTDFFDACFEEHGSVSASSGRYIAYVHFIHAGTMLAVIAFYFNPVIAHHAGDTSQQVIIGARLADGVAVHTGIERGQVWAEVFFAQ